MCIDWQSVLRRVLIGCTAPVKEEHGSIDRERCGLLTTTSFAGTKSSGFDE